MFKILGIDIPEGIAFADDAFTFAGTIESGDLKTLGEQVRDAAKTAAAGEVTVEALAEIKHAQAFVAAAKTELAARKTALAEFTADRDAVLAALDSDDLSLEDESDADEGDESDDESSDDADESDESDGDDDESVTAAAGWRPTAAAAAKTAPAQKIETTPTRKAGSYADAGFVAATGVDGKNSGDKFDSLADLGEALLTKFHEIAGGSTQKVSVGKVFAEWKPEQVLSEDMGANLIKLGGLDVGSPESMDSVTAALCAPAEPLYELATTSSTARPVKGSLATYKPARGQVSIYPTPHLSDIVDGRGIWTADDDADAEAVKAACATITCASPDTYKIYGLYRCLTIKNMLAMTFPELVEAYLNRLGAVTARLGDVTLLDGMIGSPNTKTVTATGNEYGAAINVFSSILQITSLYREEERYGDQQFDAWLPRWVLPFIQIDVMRMRKTSGTLADRVASPAEVNAAFRNVGVNVTWTLDSASSWDAPAYMTDGQEVPVYPTTISGILAPMGNLRALDRGDLSIGVAPGNIYRDNDSNTRNEFTIFQESFEGLMDMGATNWAFDLTDICPSGAQVADVDAITCPGS